jgi:hypothetical protein
LSKEAALAYAEKFGIVSPQSLSMERSLSLSKTKEVFNFSVYKWNKVRTVQRLILQFDFKSQTLSDIQQGRRAERIDFKDIMSFQSEDGLRLLIQFANYGEYELDANTLDEKNKMIRLLSSILHHYEGDSREKRLVVIKQNIDEDIGQLQPATNPDLNQSISPPPAPMMPSFLPSTVIPRTLKEGLVEKKGHSVAFLMWPERYLKVCEGELLYYKPEEREQALNIIPLKAMVTRVEKIGTRTFVVSLAHSKKSFSFRTHGSDNGKSAEMERDEWCKAILDGCRTRRKSDARLRRGTVTAKQYMEEVKIEKKQRELKKQSDMSEEQDDPFSGLDCSLNLNLPSSIIKQAPHKKEVVRRRSQTVTSSIESPGSTKSLKRGKCVTDTSKKRSSIFYVHPATTDVTTPFVLPVMEMDSLVVANRSPSELLDLMTTELESLAEYVLPTTTGKSRVDMIVTRMGNIISALRQRTIEQEDGENHQDCLSPSSIGSSHSLPSERVADESSDSCSIVSSDELCTRESPSETLATSAHSDTQSVPHHNNFSVSHGSCIQLMMVFCGVDLYWFSI